MGSGDTAGAQDTLYNAARASKGERPDGTLARPSANKFDEGFRRVPFPKQIGEKRRVDGWTIFWAVAQGWHVGDFDKIAFRREKRQRAAGADVDSDNHSAPPASGVPRCANCLTRPARPWNNVRSLFSASIRILY